MNPRTKTDRCPCDSGQDYSSCCQPLHEGLAAPTAEALMRSRYSAYVLCNAAYLLDTWHSSTRPERIEFEEDARWLGLQVRAVEPGDSQAWVEFVARYRVGGKSAVRMQERSRFIFEHDRWWYLDGQHR